MILNKYIRVIPILTAFLFLCVGYFFYFHGAKNSVFLNSEKSAQLKYNKQVVLARAPDYKQEKKFAEAYWARYPDVRKDMLWGENGTMGIRGPRNHYMNHGKKEGRFWHVLAATTNLQKESKLAEIYWSRYADVAASKMWGRESTLDIKGPRDHFEIFGRKEGRIWGRETPNNE